VSTIDCHDCIFPGEGHHVTPTRVFIKFCTLGEGPQDHETLHDVALLELMPNMVCVLQAGLINESPEVVCTWPCLTLVTVCGIHDAPHVGGACLPVVIVIVVDRGHGALRMLLAPLLAALLGAVDSNVG
jgi:hypothetical protein